MSRQGFKKANKKRDKLSKDKLVELISAIILLITAIVNLLSR